MFSENDFDRGHLRLIGILSSNYDRYEEQSLALFTRERAKIIVRFSCYFPERWLFPDFWKESDVWIV